MLETKEIICSGLRMILCTIFVSRGFTPAIGVKPIDWSRAGRIVGGVRRFPAGASDGVEDRPTALCRCHWKWLGKSPSASSRLFSWRLELLGRGSYWPILTARTHTHSRVSFSRQKCSCFQIRFYRHNKRYIRLGQSIAPPPASSSCPLKNGERYGSDSVKSCVTWLQTSFYILYCIYIPAAAAAVVIVVFS